MPPTDLRIRRPKGWDSMGSVAAIQAALADAAKALNKVIDKPAKLEKLLLTLPQGQIWLCAIQDYEMEINNGGHSQYFFNSAGAMATEALAGLKAIGAAGFASALSKAMEPFKDGTPPRDHSAREEVVETLDEEAFEKADDQFYASYTGEESLAALCLAYLNAHPDQFFRE